MTKRKVHLKQKSIINLLFLKYISLCLKVSVHLQNWNQMSSQMFHNKNV